LSRGFFIFLYLFESFLFATEHTHAHAQRRAFARRIFSVVNRDSCPPDSLEPVSLHHCGAAHQPSLRSLQTMMAYANSLLRREAGSLINRSVTICTIPDFRHPRTGSTALLLSTTTELFVVDLIAQHDPQTNAQLARHCHARFPQPLLH
jgi:hypothetical protein